jgi:predicted amidohydrolase
MDFVNDVASLLSRKALAARDDENQMIDVAAHAFATAVYLREKYGEAKMAIIDRHPGRCTGRTDALALLAGLQERAPLDLYTDAISALTALDAWFAAGVDVGRNRVFANHTAIERLGDDFHGVVRHWPRPPSQWAALRSLRDEQVQGSPPMRYRPGPEAHLTHLGMYWDRAGEHFVRLASPARAVRASIVEKLGFGPASPASFKVALCPLRAPFRPQFRVHDDGALFTIDPALAPDLAVEGAEALFEHLGEVLEDARREEVRVLVFPELCIDELTRAWLSNALRQGRAPSLLAIVAGSFHVWPDKAQSPFNETVILGSRGKLLWSHRKRGRFRLTCAQVHAMVSRQMFAPAPTFVADEVEEGIRWGDRLEVLETALGRLATIICADALDDAAPMLRAVKAAHPDLLFIVSMSDKSTPFVTIAEQLEKLGVSTLYVNAACICDLDTSSCEELAFAHLALYEPPGSAPTRVRWRRSPGGAASEEARWYDYRARPGEDRWKPMSAALHEGSAYLLPSGRGLVLDLAAHRDAPDA